MQTKKLPSTTTRRRARAWASLALCALSIASVWMLVLPRVANIGPIKQHIETMQEKNIEVDAMFYTELNWTPPSGAAWR